MANQVYGYVVDRILSEMEKGTIPWRKPWISALNYVSRAPYRGINRLLLPRAGEYITYKQASAAGGHIQKGAISHMVVFFKPMTRLEQDEGEGVLAKERSGVVLRYYRVFHLDDVEGLPSKIQRSELKDCLEASQIAKGYRDGPRIVQGSAQAYYRPAEDAVHMPDREMFESTPGYYETLFHELAHSTGHASRLSRLKSGMEASGEANAREELVAEIAAAMLMDRAGMLDQTVRNHAGYIQSWMRAIREDAKLIVVAAGQAQKAAEYILGGTDTAVDSMGG